MRSLLSTVLALLLGLTSFAHALWIETNPTGQKGKAHEVKIFYGEYSEGHPDQVADWYSDMKEFKLWLINADNEKVQLPVTAAADHFVATFNPSKDGVYQLFVSHDAKDLGRTTKYQFNTSAAVTVGKAASGTGQPNQNPLQFSVKGNSVNKTVAVQAVSNDQPAEVTVTVFSPAGWTKEIKSNASGVAEFVPEWRGKYMIEVSRTDEEKGEHHGKSFDKVWKCATALVNVK